MVSRKSLFRILACLCLVCGTVRAEPVWVVEPGNPGPDLPPQGRSLFDHLTVADGRQVVPFPYQALVALLKDRLNSENAYLGEPLKQVLIPLGRSLQREAAAPRFFESPRIVLAVDAEPVTTPDDAGMLLRDRLFIGYLEAADVLEIISYNEADARFEFQVVTGYRSGGDPQVRYARRLVCMACHQNAAPIFARPLWDETNTNADVSRQLQHTHRDFHGVTAELGVDMAYAIDNASDRANEFALTQKLWQEGCGTAAQGAACRAALLTVTLQYALSGGRGFDQASADYAESLRQPMLEVRGRLWPQGLWTPDPDIPNRRPLAGFRMQPAGAQGKSDDALARRANITAEFEPLAPRLPQAAWDPDPDTWVARAVSGLTQFLSPDDVRRIDMYLAGLASGTSEHVAPCRGTLATGEQTDRIKLDCRGDALSFSGLVYRDTAGTLSGRLRNMRLQGQDLGSLNVGGNQDPQGVYHIELARAGSTQGMRLSNGDALGQLELRWQDADRTGATAVLTVRHDFRHLAEAVRNLGTRSQSSLTGGPFRRADTLPELFESLGMEPLNWCCTQTVDMPEPLQETPEPPLESPALAPFLKVCAGCHRSGAPFPPNFLAGGADQARRVVAHCGERIQYRLAMWDIDPDRRSKTPMPPSHGADLHNGGNADWMTGLLPELRRALHAIAESESMPLPARQETIRRPYVGLRPCLPTS